MIHLWATCPGAVKCRWALRPNQTARPQALQGWATAHRPGVWWVGRYLECPRITTRRAPKCCTPKMMLPSVLEVTRWPLTLHHVPGLVVRCVTVQDLMLSSRR